MCFSIEGARRRRGRDFYRRFPLIISSDETYLLYHGLVFDLPTALLPWFHSPRP